MLAAREDLVNQLLDIAKRKNVKLYGMVNDALEWIIKAEDMGLSPEEVVGLSEIVKTAKDAGFIPVVESLWYDVVGKIFRVDRSWAMKKWYECGQWYGKYYSVKFPQDPLSAFKRDICSLVWNVSEFNILEKEDGNEVLVRCVSPKSPLSYLTLFSAFLEGIFDLLGYKCTKKDVSKGIIRLVFKREREE